jgi:LPS-assembly protein
VSHWLQSALLASLPVTLSLVAEAQLATETQAQSERVIVEADNVYEVAEDNTVIAEGNVEVFFEGRVLKADRIIYNRNTERVRATGNVIIINDDGIEQYSEEAEVGSDLSEGVAIGYSARLPEDARLAANAAIRRSDGSTILDQFVYSACEVCEDKPTPTWAIRARRARLDPESQMIHYRDALIEIGGVPVFYLPYIAHPDPNSKRRSGLLIPTIGNSSKLGAYYGQPYYWAISDHSDVTLTPQLMTNVNPLLGLELRKRFYSGAIKVEGSVTQETDFDTRGEKFGEKEWRGHVFANGAFAITPNWRWGFAGEYQSDDLYDRRYSISGANERRGLYVGQPRRLLSQLFVVGQAENYYADAAVLQFQGLRGIDDSNRLPRVAPLAFAERYWNLGDLGFASVNLSSAALTREVGADSQRVSVGAEWRDLNILPLGLAFEPFAEVRGDYYALDQNISGQSNVTRGLGNIGAKLSYPLIRPGKSVDILVEPAVMAAWGVGNPNDPAIPNEDSQAFEFDETSLFRANGFSNYDLYEGDGKLSAGLTARAIWKNGVQLSSTVGRRWRSREDSAFDRVSNLDGRSSDWIGSATLDIGRSLQANVRGRLNPEDLSLNRIDAQVSGNFWRLRSVARYYKLEPRITPTGLPDEGVYFQTEIRATDNISFLAGQLRDIQNDRNIDQRLGLAYFDDCSRLEIVYRRSELRDRTIGTSESFEIRFTLRSLGSLGSSDFD